MKNIYSVDAQCTKHHDGGNAVTVCHNLRPSRLPSGASALKPVGTPVKLSDKPMRPLTKMSVDGKSYLIAAADNTLHILNLETDLTSQPGQASFSSLSSLASLTLGSEISCALADGDQLTVMTAERAYRFRLSDGQLSETDIAELPSISMLSEDKGDVSVAVAGRTLSRSYTSGNHELADADRRAISGDIRRAYSAICRQAAAAGTFIAPMVCRYRVISRHGDTLLKSPPLLLGPSDSSRLTAPYSLKSNDRRTVESWQMALPSWRPVIRLNGDIPDSLSDIMDRIEVVASPGLHPYDSSEDASITVVSGSSAADFLHVTAAGAWKSVSSGNSRYGQARLARIACRPDCTTDIIATLHPASGMGQQITVAPSDVAEQCRQTDRLISSRLVKSDSLLQRISPPHSFTAACAVAVAGRELWGCLCAHRFDGYPAEVFAASRGGAGVWHAAVSVSFGESGERTVAISQGLSGAPLTFGPLLSYPSPDATSMTITVSTAGEVRTATFPLTPDPTNTHSIYIHPTLQPHSLTGTLPAFVIPADRKIKHQLGQYVCSCDAPLPLAPRRPAAITPAGDSRISSVWPCSRLSAGWESDRQRYIVISDAGIHRATLSLTKAKPTLTMTLIGREAPAGDNAVTEAGGSLLAAAGRHIVKIGAGTVKTIAENIDAVSIAYAAATGELWAATPQGVKVIDLKSMSCYTRDAISLGASVGNYAEVDGYTVDLAREIASPGTYVRWAGCISTGDSYRRLREMIFDLRSESVTDGSMDLRRMSHADAEGTPTCSMNVDGRVMAPLVMRCISLPTRGCRFEFQGRVSYDTTINSVKIATS